MVIGMEISTALCSAVFS